MEPYTLEAGYQSNVGGLGIWDRETQMTASQALYYLAIPSESKCPALWVKLLTQKYLKTTSFLD